MNKPLTIEEKLKGIMLALNNFMDTRNNLTTFMVMCVLVLGITLGKISHNAFHEPTLITLILFVVSVGNIIFYGIRGKDWRVLK